VDLPTLTAMCASVRCPVLVIQGTDDRISHVTQGSGLADAIPGARLEILEGSGHIPNARDPVRVNLLIREFISELARVSHARPDG
jgi:pimeloyl-ACP methyl ester carboxylesterase